MLKKIAQIIFKAIVTKKFCSTPFGVAFSAL